MAGQAHSLLPSVAGTVPAVVYLAVYLLLHHLQEGPQCGLVVLAMAACSMGSNTTVTEVAAMARARGVTKRGEMFSVHYMAGLARELIPGCSASVQPVSRLLDTGWLVTRLLAGCLLLVPYDCSANHSPGLLGGLAAHWCLVTGCLLPCPSPPPAASPLPGCLGFHFQPSPPGTGTCTAPPAAALLLVLANPTLHQFVHLGVLTSLLQAARRTQRASPSLWGRRRCWWWPGSPSPASWQYGPWPPWQPAVTT